MLDKPDLTITTRGFTERGEKNLITFSVLLLWSRLVIDGTTPTTIDPRRFRTKAIDEFHTFQNQAPLKHHCKESLMLDKIHPSIDLQTLITLELKTVSVKFSVLRHQFTHSFEFDFDPVSLKSPWSLASISVN